MAATGAVESCEVNGEAQDDAGGEERSCRERDRDKS